MFLKFLMTSMVLNSSWYKGALDLIIRMLFFYRDFTSKYQITNDNICRSQSNMLQHVLCQHTFHELTDV